jgi:hypothetical protein
MTPEQRQRTRDRLRDRSRTTRPHSGTRDRRPSH